MNLLSSKIRSLYNSFPSLLGQNSLLCQPATFKNAAARGRGQRFGGRGLNFCARDWLSTSLLQILDTPLRTLRCRMSKFGILIRDQYSNISDEELDRTVATIQHQYPICGYRMMQDYLRRLDHRVQQGRVRESVADPGFLKGRL